MRKILVAVDGSPAALHAARMALQLAQATGASLTVAHSVAPMALPGDVPFTVINEVVRAEAARSKVLLNSVITELGSPANVEQLELEGSPAERIAEVADTGGFDLVAVGSRGRNAVARLFLGSVADRLVHICKRPVMVVR